MSSSLALLPLEERERDESISAAVTALENKGLSTEESRLTLESLFEEWLDKDGIAETLPHEIQPLFAGASWADKTSTAPHTAYVKLIRKLEGKYTSTRREAAVLVSRLPIVLLLAEKMNNSPARIARLLGSGDGSDPVSWKAVQTILVGFGIRNELDETLVSRLIALDRDLTTEEYGDADAATLTELISSKSTAFGLGGDFGNSLESAPRAHRRPPVHPIRSDPALCLCCGLFLRPSLGIHLHLQA